MPWGVVADTEKAGSLLDPEHRHLVALTKMRPYATDSRRFHVSKSALETHLC